MVHPILLVSVENFTVHDLHMVLSRLKARKAPGYDDVPSEFWKMLSGNEGAVHELVKDIPEIWRLAKVVLLFQKGDAAVPENYRPVSLLPKCSELYCTNGL